MVRVEVSGFPTIEIDNQPGGIGRAKQQLRRRMRGGGGGSGSSGLNLSWSTSVPRLVLTSDTDEFDEIIIQHFLEEGYQLAYLPYKGTHQEYNAQLQHLQDSLELGEKYAIVGA